MRIMKKSMIVIGAVAVAILMVSTATAVGTVNSEPVMKKIELLEQIEKFLNENELILNEFDLEGFIDYFTSMEFANHFKNDEVQGFINGEEFTEIYNSEEALAVRNNELFISVLESDVAQQFLDNIKDNGRELILSQGAQTILAVKLETKMESTDEFNFFAGLILASLIWMLLIFKEIYYSDVSLEIKTASTPEVAEIQGYISEYVEPELEGTVLENNKEQRSINPEFQSLVKTIAGEYVIGGGEEPCGSILEWILTLLIGIIVAIIEGIIYILYVLLGIIMIIVGLPILIILAIFALPVFIIGLGVFIGLAVFYILFGGVY